MVHSGSKSVAAAGTREALVRTRTPAAWVIVQATQTNTGKVYVGGNTVAVGAGVTLASPGDSVTFPYQGGLGAYDLKEIYVDAEVNGEGVDYDYGA